MTATLFVVTGAVGRTTEWYVPEGGRAFEHAGWDELERAAARGFAIGSHTVSHLSLGGASDAAVADELGASREAIEKRFGACRHFAYPFGVARRRDGRRRAARGLRHRVHHRGGLQPRAGSRCCDCAARR